MSDSNEFHYKDTLLDSLLDRHMGECELLDKQNKYHDIVRRRVDELVDVIDRFLGENYPKRYESIRKDIISYKPAGDDSWTAVDILEAARYIQGFNQADGLPDSNERDE